jgi:SulP family sulfate permease
MYCQSANILNGFLWNGRLSMIAQTLVNLSAGSRGSFVRDSCCISDSCYHLFGAPVIELLPIAALVGVMMVAIGTFEWISLK